MNSTLVVTIGRNIGQEPMRYDQWRRFKHAVNHTLSQWPVVSVVQRPVLDSDDGQEGVWKGVVSEQAATFVALVPTSGVACVRPMLALLAAEFKQEAIGFIVADGDDNLVYPWVPG